jgi:polyferredoxin
VIADKRPVSVKPATLLGRRLRRPLDLLPLLRNAVQAGFLLFLLYTGWEFARFVAHFDSAGASPYVPRPAAVEAFLPISSLVALKSWLGTGLFDTIHPAGFVIFLTILATSILFKKGFCSWVCPVGAVSEALAKAGRLVFGRNLTMPGYPDWLLRGLKYLVLAFFVWAIWLSMSAGEATLFLRTPYNRVADVKMLQFFTNPGPEVLAFLVALAVLSMLFSNFWCRYLCPYGALLGLLSLASPLKVTRDPSRCTDCGLCTKACPNRIDVAVQRRVSSPECSGCLSCVVACRRAGALGLAVPTRRPSLSPWILPALLLGSFLAAVVVAQATGHWDTSITYSEYARLIPAAPGLSH